MHNLFSKLKHSIQKSFTFFICTLLLGVILIFGFTSYFSIRKAAVSAARERLASLTEQISSMFERMGNINVADAKKIAEQTALKAFLHTRGKDSAVVVQNTLNLAKRDSLIPFVALYNAAGAQMRGSVDIDGAARYVDTIKDQNFFKEGVGKLYVVDKKMFFPIVVNVTDSNNVIGYLVKWRMLVSSKEEMEAFSKLIGEGGKMYIGNDDNSFWTDGLKSIPAPPLNMKNVQSVISYREPDSVNLVIASANPVSGTRWLILISLSEENVMQSTHEFLYFLIITGSALLCIGVYLAWLMSRRITKPLKKLTEATENIGRGDYHLQIHATRDDEIGLLTSAFNQMAAEVRNAHQKLERKVQERTSALQAANQELEAFSYSVSHDLRAPLRIINNYAHVINKQNSVSLNDNTRQCSVALKKMRSAWVD